MEQNIKHNDKNLLQSKVIHHFIISFDVGGSDAEYIDFLFAFTFENFGYNHDNGIHSIEETLSCENS